MNRKILSLVAVIALGAPLGATAAPFHGDALAGVGGAETAQVSDAVLTDGSGAHIVEARYFHHHYHHRFHHHYYHHHRHFFHHHHRFFHRRGFYY